MVRQIFADAESKLAFYIAKGDEAKALETVDLVFTGLYILEENLPLIQDEMAALLFRIAKKFLAGCKWEPDIREDSDNPQTLLRLKAQSIKKYKGSHQQIKISQGISRCRPGN